MEEKEGRLASAGKAYQQAIDLMLGRLPRLAKEVEKPGSGGDSSGYRDSYNNMLDEMKQYYDLAVQGLIMSAPTPESRLIVLDRCRERVRTEFKELEADAAFGKKPSENPRLLRLTNLMRLLGLAYHRPEYFEPMDDKLLAIYSGNTGLFATMLDQRRRWGLTIKAREFLARYGQPADDMADIGLYLDKPDKLKEMLQRPEPTPGFREKMLPLLSMVGHDDLIDWVLTKSGPSTAERASTVPPSSAALATQRPALIRKDLLDRLSKELTAAQTFSTGRFQDQIAAAWPALDAEDRNSVANQFRMIADRIHHVRRRESWPFQYDLLARVGRSAELDPKQLSVFLKPDPKGKTSEAHAWGAVMRWFLDKPVGERPAALDQLMEPHAAEGRIFMLAQFAMLLEEKDVSAALEATFRRLLDGAELPAESAKPFRMFFTGYQENRLTELVRKRMADHESGDLAVDILSGAIAQGDTARSRFEAKIAAGKAELLANIGAIYGLYDSTLRLAADSLAPAQLDRS